MIFIIITLSIFALDQYIKWYVDKNRQLHSETPILNGKIIIDKYYNRGAMLNLLKNNKVILFTINTFLVVGLTIYYSILIFKKGNVIVKIALSFILGGAFSNYYDRIKRGHVIDYFSFSKIKNIIFNIADMFIFLGSILYLIYELFQGKK